MKKSDHLEAVTINKKLRLMSKRECGGNWTEFLYSG